MSVTVFSIFCMIAVGYRYIQIGYMKIESISFATAFFEAVT